MSSRDSGGAFWEAEVDGVIDMGLCDPWPPDFAHYWLSEVDPLLPFNFRRLCSDCCCSLLHRDLSVIHRTRQHQGAHHGATS